jgi:hypothetical protein
MKRLIMLSVFFGVGMVCFNACEHNDLSESGSSFQLIEQKILSTSCSLNGCHLSESDDAFRQHGLVLAGSVAYKNLVNVAPFNLNAKNDGLVRVKPGNPEESLLFHKVHGNNDHHHVGDYGNPMPLGLELLTVGQVEFIKQWIEAGAPEKGAVADPALLDDKTLQPENFEALTPPEPGKGLQLTIGPFKVAPQFERELFVYKKLGNDEDIFVNRIEIKMRRNSHHFILYDFNEEFPSYFTPVLNNIRDIRNTDGSYNVGNMIPMAYHVFVSGTQTPYFDYSLPAGVVIPFKAGAAIDFNSHYVNKGDDEIDGEVYVNLHSVPAAQAKKIAKSLNLANQNLSLPAKQKTTVTKSFTFGNKISILSLTSHTHQLAEKFVIKIKGGPRDGEIVYTNLDWHHPIYMNVDPPIVLNPGEGLTSEITYNNTTDKLVKFGLTSEDEMGIIFGYYVED